ncbi:MAG: nitrous oxide reductase accessory protein NosL [Chitinophagaceae bacterium]
MKNTFMWPRLLVVIASLILIGALFLPIWRIELAAPQYPEGLALEIYANALAGDVDVINGLNHYIGMKTLHTEDFIEFTILPYIIGSFVVLGLFVALINKKKLYYIYIGTFILFGIVSMVDFYRWNYNYGHNLDPMAAIQVPGMSYQPPLIGYKQLLNFGAYSIPASGGWLFIGSGVLLLIAFILLLKPKWLPFQRKKGKVAIAMIVIFFIQSCSPSPLPIVYGKDGCEYCMMTIMDKRFAAEWVTETSKVYRFDDVHCLVAFRKTDKSKGTAYINDYSGGSEMMKAEDLMYLQSEKIKSPMGGNVAAFKEQASLKKLMNENQGKQLTWNEVQAEMKK